MSRIVTEIEQLYRKASQRGMSVRLTVSQANGETTTTLALTTPTANCGEPPVEKKQRSRDRQKQNSRYFFDKRKSKKEEITKPTTPKPKQEPKIDVSATSIPTVEKMPTTEEDPMREALRSWDGLAYARGSRYREPDFRRVREEALRFWEDPVMAENVMRTATIFLHHRYPPALM